MGFIDNVMARRAEVEYNILELENEKKSLDNLYRILSDLSRGNDVFYVKEISDEFVLPSKMVGLTRKCYSKECNESMYLVVRYVKNNEARKIEQKIFGICEEEFLIYPVGSLPVIKKSSTDEYYEFRNDFNERIKNALL